MHDQVWVSLEERISVLDYIIEKKRNKKGVEVTTEKLVKRNGAHRTHWRLTCPLEIEGRDEHDRCPECRPFVEVPVSDYDAALLLHKGGYGPHPDSPVLDRKEG